MFTLDDVVPWGRSFEEYRRMFALTGEDLGLRIVDCAGGPASFNAEATRLGAHVVSCDPIYRWEGSQILERIAATCDLILEQTRHNRDEFVWDSIRSVEELGQIRMAAMRDFLYDYGSGKSEGRYLDAELPALPFTDASFDLALCSHFLFLYTAQLGDVFHRSAIREMCRVAAEVRIFPLLALDARRSPYADQMGEEFGLSGFEVSIEKVPYEFQRGGNEMMRIRRVAASCAQRGRSVYRLEVNVFWDDEPGDDIRVVAAIDDGSFFRAILPMADDFILGPDGTFVGEDR